MKRQIFSVMALSFIVATALTMSSCKKDTLTIKKQWLLLDENNKEKGVLWDISCTKDGYIIVARHKEEMARKNNLPEDTYFIKDSVEITKITSTSKTSGVIKIKYNSEEANYKDLTNNTVIFYDNKGGYSYPAKAAEKPISLHEWISSK